MFSTTGTSAVHTHTHTHSLPSAINQYALRFVLCAKSYTTSRYDMSMCLLHSLSASMLVAFATQDAAALRYSSLDA